MATLLTPAERALVEGTWPIELLSDPRRAPIEVRTPTDFAYRVLLSSHLEDVVRRDASSTVLYLVTSPLG